MANAMPMFCRNCGDALTGRGAFCSACGNPVEPAGVATPSRRPQYNSVGDPINPTQDESAEVRGKQPRIRKGQVLGVVLALAVLLVLFATWNSQPDGPTATSTVQEQESQQRDPYIPPLQKSFTSMIESFIKSYDDADTEVRKTNVRFERKDAIARYFSETGHLRFQGWVGEVKELTTESDGKAHVSIKLKGSETVITTWNNSLSDISSNTMISRDEAIYQSLMDIKEGDQVAVSGAFLLVDSGQDYVREASLTEQGAMVSPEFIVSFSQISKGIARTSLSVRAQWVSVAVLGFKAGESPKKAAEHAVDLGMTKAGDCQYRKDGNVTSPQYVDCEFFGSNRGSLETSFYSGQLQRIEYKFPITQYDAILEEIEKSFGNPRILTDPHDPSEVLGPVWGGYAEKFYISLGKTADGANGWASIIFDTPR